jgi:hypothetical protein
LENYVLQLAHTTNIPFTYTISYAELLDSEPADLDGVVVYTASDKAQTRYYYRKVASVSTDATQTTTATTLVPGKWLNSDTTDAATALADSAYHALTYGSYNNVQKNAEPLYWQSSALTPRSEVRTSEQKFCDYYILTISWSGLKNDRETDLVYLMAGYSAQTS